MIGLKPSKEVGKKKPFWTLRAAQDWNRLPGCRDSKTGHQQQQFRYSSGIMLKWSCSTNTGIK